MGKRMAASGALLLGRRPYEALHGYWPRQRGNPYTEVLNDARKYVASRTLAEPLPWRNSTLLSGDLPGAGAALRAEPGADIAVLAAVSSSAR